MIKQTVLPFKLEETKDLITPDARLSLLGEFTFGLGILAALLQKYSEGMKVPFSKNFYAAI
ncbi:MAG: hypothetical protein GY874_12165 [Desulfobacteraceae bacterium]|nr:hypothetical protein [Desulfobacteraceae bacterium]